MEAEKPTARKLTIVRILDASAGPHKEPYARTHRPALASIRTSLLGCAALLVAAFFAPAAHAQESAYIVAYDHYMEEPGSLEVEYFSTFGTQRNGNDFHSFWTEFEYGATAWWTTELYLDAQTTFHDSTIFTGFRWENRFRLLKHEHFLNPVLYVEYEHTSEADKILKEIEGHDVESDFAGKERGPADRAQ